MARPPKTERTLYLFNYPTPESVARRERGEGLLEPSVEALRKGGTWSRIQAFHDIRDLGDELAEVWDR